MKKELIVGLLEKFEKAAYDFKGIECWSARELCEILGYSQWRNFVNAIEKAKIACKNGGEDVSDHFVDISKMVELFSSYLREVGDIVLISSVCHSIAQKEDLNSLLNQKNGT